VRYDNEAFKVTRTYIEGGCEGQSGTRLRFYPRGKRAALYLQFRNAVHELHGKPHPVTWESIDKHIGFTNAGCSE
jgi:hypothetical protein